MRIPKAIVFDYGGTLVDSHYFDPLKGTEAVMKHANNPNGVTAEEVQAYANQVIEDAGAFDGSNILQMDSRALTRLIYGVHGITFDRSLDELDAIFLDAAEGTSLMEGLVDLLEFLKGLDIRLAVLSNTGFTENSHRMQLRKYGIEDYFEFFIATSEYLIRKPDKRIFDVALSKLSLACHEVWYIGNSFEFDIVGSDNAGIFPVWINTAQETVDSKINYLDVKSYPDLTVMLKEYLKK